MHAWLRYVALAARLRVQHVRAQWREHGPAGPHGAVDAILGAAELPAPADSVRDALGPARAGLQADPRWRRLADLLELTALDQDLLALLAATHVEPRLSLVLGYLEDDNREHAPTLGAAARLFGWPPGATPGRSSALVRWAIATTLEGEAFHPSATWTVDPDIVGYLCGADGWERFWPGLASPGPPAIDCLHPRLLDELLTAARSLQPLALELVGRAGSGRRTLLRQVCAGLGRGALVIERSEQGVRARRTARLLGAVPIWVDPPDARAELDLPPESLTLVAREAACGGVARSVHLSFAMPDVERDARLALWRQRTATAPPAPVRDWSLTPAEIERAAAAAAAGAEAVTAQLRRRIAPSASTLMTRVVCPYVWEDLIVAEPVLTRLRDLESEIRLAVDVLDGWGFRRLTPERRGTTALFAGPSGTGKTMAASVLARSLQLDLYRVDLSQVVDKYIGETEKRLAHVFDECERSRVVVLFDEADALFGHRTRVRDAHDRFANIEIDYLLARMDTFDGVAILATNRKSDLDPAFMRRIRAIVDFLTPSPAERLRLWEIALPRDFHEAVGPAVDHDHLAASLELSPAEIKAVAIAAAFLARAAGEVVGPEHLTAAARRELAKRGAILRPQPIANGNGLR